jgi:predicted HAD superfamily Cof-like phosphohydrolase
MITENDIKAMDTNGIMWEYFNITPDGKSTMTVMEMVKEFSKVLDQKTDTALYTQLVIEEFDEWLAEGTCVEDDLKELADLVYVIYGYANACGYDLDEAIRRVHANNLGRCVQPDGSILRREDGKIIKNKGYPKVDLSDLV